MRLDDDIVEAMRKIEQMEEITARLPGYDCGSCGSPTCKTFAEDIVRGFATELDCIHILKERLKVMAQQMDLALAGITILINLCYSVLIIWILAKMYDSENILFTDGFHSFKVFEKRSDIKPGTVPKTGDLILSVVVLLLLSLYLGIAVSAKSVFGSNMPSF